MANQPDIDPLEVLYRSMQRSENKVGGGEGLEGIYGSVTRTGMSEVLRALKQHSGLDQHSIVVDVGAGLGRPLLHAIVEVGVARTFGVELDVVKCQKAVPFIKHTVADLEAEGIAVASSSLPTILCTPAERLGSLEPATHAYAAWEGFPTSAMIAIGELFAATKSLKAITVVQRSFRQQDPAEEMASLGFGPVQLVASIPVYMAGSRRRLNAYVFVKEPVGTSGRTGRSTAQCPGTSAPTDNQALSYNKGGPSLLTMKPFAAEDVLAELAAQSAATRPSATAAEGCRDAAGPADQGMSSCATDPSCVSTSDGRSARSRSVPAPKGRAKAGSGQMVAESADDLIILSSQESAGSAASIGTVVARRGGSYGLRAAPRARVLR